jgi:lysophospholipase L1-like esterase
MKSKTSKILSVFATILLLISLIACNSETPTPTDGPTDAPTDAPTDSPTDAPTDAPTDSPTDAPTDKPTEKPNDEPEEPSEPELIPAPAPLNSKKYDLSAENNKIRRLGRADLSAEGINCDHTAAGIEFQAFMTGELSITITSSMNESFFTVYIDGERSDVRYEVRPGTTTLKIAEFEGNYLHSVRILKQTEPKSSLATINKIQMTGYIVDAPDEREFFIEFVGDSLTCGYGNIGEPGANAPASPLWQDGTQAYAFIAAEKLGAESSIIACSGIGVDKGWPDYEAKEFYSSVCYQRDPSIKYEFDKIPDLVVIHLGANDYALDAAKDSFIARSKALVEYIRDGYECDVPIIWAYEPKEGRPEWIKIALDELGGEDEKLYMLALSQNTDGANGHPTVPSHIEAADTLCDFIESKKLLEFTE